MSMDKLRIKTDQGIVMEIEFDGKEFELKFDTEIMYIWLDRSQAHLLMLYLQEHLK